MKDIRNFYPSFEILQHLYLGKKYDGLKRSECVGMLDIDEFSLRKVPMSTEKCWRCMYWNSAVWTIWNVS